MRKITLIFCFLSSLCYAQERINLYGSITGSGSVENIHILNKNTEKGTISDAYGRFQIAAQPQDTIIISGIQFYYQELVITEEHIQNKTIPVDLLQRINELDEVTVRSHDLLGNLQTDAQNAKIDKSKVNKSALDFSNIDLSAPYLGPNDEVTRRKPPDPFGGNHGVPGFSAGGDILGLVGLVLSPVINSIGKIGETKRKNKIRKKQFEHRLEEAPKRLVIAYKNLLEEDLKIPTDQLDAFIQHCNSQGIIALYAEDRQLEVMDILIQQSEIFLKSLKKN